MAGQKRRSSRLVVGALASAACAPIWMAGGAVDKPASAAGSSCGANEPLLVGRGSAYSTAIYGARAEIERNVPQLCSSAGGSPSLSTAWAMVNSRNNYWAQAGYIKVGEESPNFPDREGMLMVSQWMRANRGLVTRFAPDPGGERMYSVYQSRSDGHIHMRADGIQIDETEYNPSGVWDPAWSAQYAGETRHYASDVPGTASDKTTFSYLQRYDGNGGVHFVGSFPLDVNEAPWRYKKTLFPAAVGGYGMNIWTDPL